MTRLPIASPRSCRAAAAPGSRRGSRGQSIVEFAVVLPVLLLLVGAATDFARLYAGWTNLESATRDAAQYLATSNTDPLAADYTTPGDNVAANDAKAQFILGQETGTTFARANSQNLGACDAPTLTTSAGALDTSIASGGSSAYPVEAVLVKTCRPFHTLFSYPFFTQNGNWILRSERTYTVVVGR